MKVSEAQMIRAVLDTDIIVSALLQPLGPSVRIPQRFLELEFSEAG